MPRIAPLLLVVLAAGCGGDSSAVRRIAGGKEVQGLSAEGRRHAREVWGYEKVVLAGWSGGGSLALFYQSQAERPTVTHTPAGDPCHIVDAGLLPADGFIFQAAHVSRAVVLADWIDPSVLDENDPDRRDPDLDLYHPDNKPP